jgi:hypothetical protein
MKGYLSINIRKPIYGNYCGIRDKYIFQSKKYHKDLRITTPLGVTTISPTKFMQGADRIEKVFLIPDRPMVLWCRHLIPDTKESEKSTIEDFTIPKC